MSVLPAAVTRNWTLKLASLALAVFLWAVVRAEPADREVLTGVPVLVQVGDLDWREAAPPEPATVQVRFAGPARQIIGLDRRNAAVRVPLDAVSSADTAVQLRRDWVVVDGASGLVVEDVQPSSILVHLERTTLEARPVAVATTGAPPEGFAVAGPPSVSPSVVRVRGTESRLAEIDSVRAGPVELDGVRGSRRFTVALDTTGLGDLTINPLEVEVAVRVEASTERVLPPVPVEVEGPAAAGLELEPPALGVTVRGPATRTTEADLSTLRLVVPDEEVLDIGPGEFRRVPVAVRGISDPYLTIRADRDSVTVRRPPGVLDSLPVDDGGGTP